MMKPNWFVALPVRESEELISMLARTAPPAIRLFDPADTHLTIAFMGSMPKENIPDVLEVMQKIDFEPFKISLAALVPLPSAKHPTAFSYTLQQGHAEVVQLIENWRDALLKAGGAPEAKRPALPHLTIGRPLRQWGKRAQLEGIRWANALTTPQFETYVDSIALYTWADDRRSRQFKIVEERLM
ncbi:MAG: 2'-5' RNA ligase family protein [Cytophagales bacterium]|nr:hypothetical protein [Bernardetiaceae bacterium]MDW8205472.1 2'-5' RNA ligase family protein [Cytophagales bacterium]